MKCSTTVAGIDLGGSAIKGVVCRSDGTVIKRGTYPTPDCDVAGDGKTPAFAGAVSKLLQEIAPSVEQIGLSTPGLVDSTGEHVTTMPGRLTGLEGFNWSKHLPGRVSLINDAHSALLAESWSGSAVDCANVLLLTLGTGVGGAAIVDGNLIRGAIGRAGHVGHITTDFEGPSDICGTPGSLEDAMGNHSIVLRSQGRFNSTAALLEALRDGDKEASTIWSRSIRALAAGITSLINVLDPERVVIGGGIAQAGELLFQPLTCEMDRIEWRPEGHRVRIVPAAHDHWAGAIGAAKNALDRNNAIPDGTIPQS